ncbi:NUDIX domain-containing protein [Candidatus Pacearchaeota archaeon]|nr:NUDIX domain-containing protein [Candidatus Pacearchaeota archaeon]
MTQKTSSGLLMYKFDKDGNLRIFLVHPGGPFWKDKDKGSWSIPKGEIDDGENELFETARRELYEETGIKAPEEKEKYIELGEVTQKSGKVVCAWAFEGDWTGLLMCSIYVEVEWPYKSGKKIKVPEVDKAGFFKVAEAKEKINERQKVFIDKLIEFLAK